MYVWILLVKRDKRGFLPPGYTSTQAKPNNAGKVD